MKYLSLLVLVTMFSTGSYAETTEPPSPVAREYLKNLEKPIVVRGDYFKAITVAYGDFERILEQRRAAAESPTTGTSDRERFKRLAAIENYDIHVRNTPATYVVTFGVTFRGDTPLLTMGAGMRYVLDRNSFTIKEKAPAK